jgi:hypothetical protein
MLSNITSSSSGIDAGVARVLEERRNEQDPSDKAMSLPLDQVQSNPTFIHPTTHAEVSNMGHNKNTWSVSIGGISYVIEDIFCTRLESAINLACEYSSLLTGDQAHVDFDRLKQHLTSLASRFMREPHEAAAQEASKDFAWPSEARTQDLTELRSCGSIKELIRRRQESVRPSRINSERVMRLFKDNSQLDKLCQLAQEGVIIDTPEDFIPLTQPPKMRPLQRKLINAFRMHALKKWHKGKILILPYAELDPVTISSLHFNCVHWTIKPKTEDSPGNVLGRPLIDPSHGNINSFLNTPDAKAKAIARYSKCNDTDMGTMATKWLRYCEQHGYKWSECSLAKDDIAEAFTQLCFSPDSAVLMCTSIDDEFFALDLNGNFGHTSLPMAFNFASQPHLTRVRGLVDAEVDKYVDDYMIFAHDSKINQAQEINQQGIKAYFGDAAIELDKSVLPTKTANIIGWFVNLLSGRIRPNDKGINKLLFVFLFVDERSPQPLKVFQLMSSLAERYSQGIRGMRAFVDPITNMTRNWSSRKHFTKRQADSNARFSIEIWRVVAILLWIDKDFFSVPIESFACGHSFPVNFKTKTDASPWKLAAALLTMSNQVIAYATLLLPFKDPENKYQNVKEFLGGLLGCILASVVLKPTSPVRVQWIGDNTSALTWAKENKCSSRAAQYANIAYTWFQVYSHTQLHTTQHCAGVDMGVIDGLSRDFPTPGLDPKLEIKLDANITIQSLFQAMDPTRNRNLVDHHEAFKDIHMLLRQFK